MEGLFELLQAPERLTAAAVSEGRSRSTLYWSTSAARWSVIWVLRDCAPLREAYDRATFACGLCAVCESWSLHRAGEVAAWSLRRRRRGLQRVVRNGVVQHRPAPRRGAGRRVATNCAPRVGCAGATRCARLAHGAKMSEPRRRQVRRSAGRAAAAPDALDSIRRRAARHLLGRRRSGCWTRRRSRLPSQKRGTTTIAMESQQMETRSRRLGKPEPVAGRSCTKKRTPARRLRLCGSITTIISGVVARKIIRAGRAALGARRVRELPRRGAVALHLCVVVRDERAPPLGLPGVIKACGDRLMRSSLEADAFVRPGWRWDAAIRVARRGGIVEEEEGEQRGDEESDEKLARRLQRRFDDEAVQRARSDANGPPAARLGEWLAASLGYLLLFVDGDDLFCAHACGALSKLASIDASRVSAASGAACRSSKSWRRRPAGDSGLSVCSKH